jgi:hypothetical protein
LICLAKLTSFSAFQIPHVSFVNPVRVRGEIMLSPFDGKLKYYATSNDNSSTVPLFSTVIPFLKASPLLGRTCAS